MRCKPTQKPIKNPHTFFARTLMGISTFKRANYIQTDNFLRPITAHENARHFSVSHNLEAKQDMSELAQTNCRHKKAAQLLVRLAI